MSFSPLRAVLLASAFLIAAPVYAAVSITSFTINPPSTLEGQNMSVAVSVGSSRILDGFYGSVTWGDGGENGNGGFSSVIFAHTYLDEGVYSISFGGTGF